ncbi:hypothetical protein [Flavobacterium aquicola]|uniref:Uncharacterized protein n=1 Tax=Flavobacterium aquicola TaxID=1682742 RepID=A0A3E0DYF4_9FLAO|nr:hypothetical protein [Flavobacterium aquicola]REG91117.1 hypothetical protein C8P67_11710 [Flavobacterium aquicola]
MENISNFQNKNEKKKERQITATTTDLGIGINGKMVLYLDDLANPKIGLNLVPNPL